MGLDQEGMYSHRTWASGLCRAADTTLQPEATPISSWENELRRSLRCEQSQASQPSFTDDSPGKGGPWPGALHWRTGGQWSLGAKPQSDDTLGESWSARAHGGPEVKHPECQALLASGDHWDLLLPRGQVLEGTGLGQRRAPKSQMYGSVFPGRTSHLDWEL